MHISTYIHVYKHRHMSTHTHREGLFKIRKYEGKDFKKLSVLRSPSGFVTNAVSSNSSYAITQIQTLVVL